MANEGADAVRFTAAVLAKLTDVPNARFFAVFDRANKDASLDQMRAYALTEPRLTVVWAPENRCVVDAYMRGYKEALAAGSDWVLEIDAGFSHSPDDIPQFINAMEQGWDCVFGSRFMPGGDIFNSARHRYFISRGGTLLANLLLGTRQTDMTSGFQLFTRETLEMILRRGIVSRAHFFQTEMKTYCRKLRLVEVPIHYQAASPRLGSSAIKDAFRHLFRLFRLRLKGEL
jgi:dolichol-phosphate mannosyltransferase